MKVRILPPQPDEINLRKGKGKKRVYLPTGREMRQIDLRAEKEFLIPSLLLMENAGIGVVRTINQQYPHFSSFALLCGKGNNGGDGFVVARHLYHQQKKVVIYLLADPTEIKGDSLVNYQICQKLGIKTKVVRQKKHLKSIQKSELIIDALLGTGIKGEIKGFYREVIEFINQLKKPVLAIDIPSGVDAETGFFSSGIKAEVTVTMEVPKLGLYLYPGASLAGKVIPVSIGIPEKCFKDEKIKTRLITKNTCCLPPRRRDTHKGHYGRIFVLAGSRGMTGAAYLCSLSALLAGAGLVYLGLPESLHSIMVRKLTEVILIPLPETKSGTLSLKGEPKILAQLKNKDVLCLGPGLSQEEETVDLVRKILNQTSLPTVLDADGLNAISNLNQLAHLKGQLIITPHLGEMSRLIKREIKFIQENKIAVAREVAGKLKAVVVLKGAHSVIAQPNGEIYLNPTGNPGLASAGVGDVLTGLIAGLVGQRFSLIQSALTGTYLHGLAGDEVAREKGEFSLRATDLLRKIPLCLKKLTSSA